MLPPLLPPPLPGHACAPCVFLPLLVIVQCLLRISVPVAVAVVLGPVVCRCGGTKGQPRPSVERSSRRSCCCCSHCTRTLLHSRVGPPLLIT
ncbi:hypothetical protein BJV78DRAFT_1252248 [Lactifluus subvellereus]|nr:hypothetical protein BJV78DRAFT_1269109 [Lactifluus subvellereus]KAI0246687.1 hypothetical protein BJV78DRAFT_1252248 [Lactifluus subvellereus]